MKQNTFLAFTVGIRSKTNKMPIGTKFRILKPRETYKNKLENGVFPGLLLGIMEKFLGMKFKKMVT